MPKFHQFSNSNGQPFSVNEDHVVALSPTYPGAGSFMGTGSDEEHTKITLVTGDYLIAAQPYADVSSRF